MTEEVTYLALSAKGNKVASFSTLEGARLFRFVRAEDGVKILIEKVTTIRETVE